MFQARSIFTPEELLTLKQKSNWRGAWMIVHAWGVIFLAMAMFVKWPNPLTFILAAAIIGARQLGLAVISHDAAHGLLFSNMRLNDFAGTWLTDYILLGDMYSYRKEHVAGHHRFTQQPNDPDLYLTKPFPITRTSLKRKLIRDITGQTAYKQRRGLFRRAFAIGKPMPLVERVKHAWPRLGNFFISSAILFAILAVAGYWWLYPALWLLPWFTFQPLVVRIRAIAEHSMVKSKDDPFLNTRTTYTNFFTRAFIAPYFVNYHLEHHLLMSVPCYNQPKMHQIMIAKGLGSKMEIQPGYRAVLKLATSKPEASELQAAA